MKKINLCRLGVAVITLAAATLLSACSVLSPVYEGKYRAADWWAPAEVLEVGGVQGRPRIASCGKESDARSSDQLYAYVKYRTPQKTNRRAVPIASDQSFRRGDLVYVNIKDCEAPLIARSSSR